MSLSARDLLPFPDGDNSSDTTILGAHYNLTTLKYWNYTYYSNNTISNGSCCYLLFEPYTPLLLQNGTFLNNTSCYSPIFPIRARSITGLTFAVFFAFSIMFTFINLRKHGRLFLPSEKRFRAVGGRWQWYWMLAVAAFGLISGITSIDVDRYYLPDLPLILSNFFWFLMLLATTASVWESVRHWGSWQERQMVDPDPFILRQDDTRSRTEFYLPLVFYFFWWMDFFMVIPRSWTNIKMQRSPDQTRNFAEPTATDIRFKLGAFFLFAAWLTTIYSLYHSVLHYKPRHRGIHNKIIGFIKYTPGKHLLVLPVSLVMIGYSEASAFNFSISPLNLHPDLGMMYGLGWGTIAFIILVLEIAGYLDPNEDRELIRQRQIRGQEIDAEMGIVKKPHWWSRLHGNNRDMNVHERIAKNVAEVGGGQATARNIWGNIELGNMPVSKRRESKLSNDTETIKMAAGLLFPTPSRIEASSDPFTDVPPKGTVVGSGNRSTRTTVNTSSDSNHSSNSGITLTAPRQQVRSMLDI